MKGIDIYQLAPVASTRLSYLLNELRAIITDLEILMCT